MKKRITCFILALLLLLSAGCSSLPVLGGGGGASGTIGGGETRLENGKLALEIGEYGLDGEAECTIEPVKDPPALEGVNVHAYEFHIDTDEEFVDVMQLTIPYDTKAVKDGADVCAAYYNEETAEWEPVSFTVNEDQSTVTIFTDHLSLYGCFEVNDENTKNAYAAYAIPALALSSLYKANVDPNALVEQAVEHEGMPSDDAISVGMDVLGNTLSLGGAATETAEFFITTLGGNSGILKPLTDRIGQLGYAVGVAQVAYGMYNIYQGDADAVFPCYANALKTSTSYVGGKLGGNLFGLAFVGVMCIDYSLNKFATEALSGRKDIYNKAYHLYYESAGVKRTAKDWAAIFLKAQNGAANAARYQLRIEGLVDRYANQFWQDDLVIAAYQAEAMEHGFTGGGGLNEKVMAEISNSFKVELYKGVLQEAFKILAKKQALVAEKALLEELNAIKKELNKKYMISLYDGSLTEEKKVSQAAGYTAYVTVSDNTLDAKDWSVTLNNKGEGEITATLLGLLMAGMPSELELYEAGKEPGLDSPLRTIPFTVAEQVTKVDVGRKPLPLEALEGTYEDGTLTFADVFVSDELQASVAASHAEAADAAAAAAETEDPFDDISAGCDLPSVVEMIQAMEGQSYPAPCRIVALDAIHGTGKFYMVMEMDGESGDPTPVPFTYDETTGELTLSYEEDSATLSGKLLAQEEDANTVRVSGTLRLTIYPDAFYVDLKFDGTKPINLS